MATELTLTDFTDITKHIHAALEKINTVFTSGILSENEKSTLGELGRAIFRANHDMEHLFMDLEAVPETLKEELHNHFHH